jgi:hypothetical protein
MGHNFVQSFRPCFLFCYCLQTIDRFSSGSSYSPQRFGWVHRPINQINIISLKFYNASFQRTITLRTNIICDMFWFFFISRNYDANLIMTGNPLLYRIGYCKPISDPYLLSSYICRFIILRLLFVFNCIYNKV